MLGLMLQIMSSQQASSDKPVEYYGLYIIHRDQCRCRLWTPESLQMLKIAFRVEVIW